MSVWSSLEGVIDIRRGCDCSVRKSRNEGQGAMDISNKFIEKILEHDPKAYIDLTFNTRLVRG